METTIEGFTDADESTVSASIPASEAAVPVPLAAAPVPAPLLLASAEPSANALVSAVRAAVSTEPLLLRPRIEGGSYGTAVLVSSTARR